ncbi:DUF4294 domain-containing protein [Flavobacterium suncheonense]|uniref:DUF4294 domain-containing protein n=1 Tax=Flavobacterium suncheonense TaxID=350894 RepID=UPI000426823A|nr:DUF4294 domain-containing protein [Flavobacterium suncheonense]
MRITAFLPIVVLFTVSLQAQVVVKDSVKTENDTTIVFSSEMDELIISKDKAFEEEQRKMRILERRVLKVYPYAKLAADNLVILNANMAKLKTEREKKKYFKIAENYLENEFGDRLKKFSRKDGQILIKLINRQTGKTTYALVKDLKSGWKAFWSNNTAKLFDLNMKDEYEPFTDLEDFYIESILIKAFNTNRLQKQNPAKPIDLAELAATWKERINQSKKSREERLAKEKAAASTNKND